MTVQHLHDAMLKQKDLPAPYDAMSLKAERDLLAALILNLDTTAAATVNPGWFRTAEHLTLYFAILRASVEMEACDVVTVSEVLDQQGLLDQVGGLSQLGRMVLETEVSRIAGISQVVEGLFKLRAMAIPPGYIRVVVPLENAIANGWHHGRAWNALGMDVIILDAQPLFIPDPTQKYWVCYAYLGNTKASEASTELRDCENA